MVGDVGWWLGRVDERRGVFPLNYVTFDDMPVDNSLLAAPITPRADRNRHSGSHLPEYDSQGGAERSVGAVLQGKEPRPASNSILKEITFTSLRLQKLIGRGMFFFIVLDNLTWLGGFGSVYLASYQGRDVAVKLIESSMMSDSELVQKSQELK